MKSAEELERACLSYEGAKLRISEIIFKMVGDFINEPIQQNGPNKNYGQSELYRKLEKAIQNDARYLERKRKFQQNHTAISETKRSEDKANADFYATQSERIKAFCKKFRPDRPSSGLGFNPSQRY